MEAPILAVQFSDATTNLINAFNPGQVWLLDPKSIHEKQFLTSLGPLLTQKNITNFAVELNEIEHFKEKDKLISGFLNMFRFLGMIPGEPTKHNPPRFKRQQITSENAGVFLPSIKPLQQIEKGDVLGTMISFKDLSQIEVKCPKKGTIMQIKMKSLVKTGDVLCAIGDKYISNL